MREGDCGEEDSGSVSSVNVSAGPGSVVYANGEEGCVIGTATLGDEAVGVLVSIGGRELRSMTVVDAGLVEIEAARDEAEGRAEVEAIGGTEYDGGGGKEGSRRPAEAGRFMPCDELLVRRRLARDAWEEGVEDCLPADEEDVDANGVVGETDFNFPLAVTFATSWPAPGGTEADAAPKLGGRALSGTVVMHQTS